MASTGPSAQSGITAIASRQRADEAARVLPAALTTAGLQRLARLVIADPACTSSPTIDIAMRPDEARELAALVDRAHHALGG
jgi:hypothetical protein